MIAVYDQNNGLVHCLELILEHAEVFYRVFHRTEVVVYDIIAVFGNASAPYGIAPVERPCVVRPVPLIADIKRKSILAGGNIVLEQPEHFGEEVVIVCNGITELFVILLGEQIVFKAEICVYVISVIKCAQAWVTAAGRVALLTQIPDVGVCCSAVVLELCVSREEAALGVYRTAAENIRQ